MKDSNNIIVVVIVAVIALIGIIVMLVAPSVVNNFSDAIGYAASIYPNFENPINTFTTQNLISFASTDTQKEISFSVNDDAVYKTAYISISGGTWQPITVSGTILSGNWLQKTTTGTYTITKAEITNGLNTDNYIIIYTCTKNTTTNPTTWDCHNNKWQIKTFNTTKTEVTPPLGLWNTELLINGGFETGDFTGWNVVGNYWAVGFKPSQGNSTPQSGNNCAFVNTGETNPSFNIYQDVNLTPYATEIIAQKAFINASGYFISSEYSGQDKGRIQILFLDASKNIIQPIALDTGEIETASWQQKGIKEYVVPYNARHIRIWGTTYEPRGTGFGTAGSLDSFSVKIEYKNTTPTCTCSYSNECSQSGTANPAGCMSCTRNTNGKTCSNGVGTCSSGICTVSPPPEQADYFVATPENGGSDYNDGKTINTPFATWQKAFDEVQPGELVYIRGGIYETSGYYASGSWNGVYAGGKSGTEDEPINVFAFPGETPILDCSEMTADDERVGIAFEGSAYWHIKGLTVTNVPAIIPKAWTAVGFSINGYNNIIENCVSHDIEGPGFTISGDNNLILNCDSYNNYDDKVGGENADGFVIGNVDYRYTNTFRGCRAWHNSDDGYDTFGYEGTAIYENCWSFGNGAYDSSAGDGAGFKLGITSFDALSDPQRVYTNCIAANNKLSGFDESQDPGSTPHINHMYNSISYNNAEGFSFGYSGSPTDTIRNCISYNDRPGSFGSNTVDHNSWQTGFTVTDADFESVDSSELEWPRNADGSLPDITFMHLNSTSRLINAGIDVGLPYKGSAPDIGAFEYK